MSAAELPVPFEGEVPEGMRLDKDGVLRSVGKPFAQGNDYGTNGGRKKGLARRIREMVGDDPTRIADVLFDILEDPLAKNADRINAAKELLDRGWGKAPTFTPIEGGDPLERSELDQAIRDIAEQLLLKRQEHAIVEHKPAA
jgi:hypothetical protein